MQYNFITMLIVLTILSCSIFSSGYFYITIGGQPIISLFRCVFVCLFASFVMKGSILRIPGKYLLASFIVMVIIVVNLIKCRDYGSPSYNIRLIFDCYFLIMFTSIIYAVLHENKIRPDIKFIMSLVKFICIVIACVSAIEVSTGQDLFGYNLPVLKSHLYRINATFNSPEQLSFFLTIMNLMLLTLQFKKTNYIYIGLNLFSIFNTYHRTAYIVNFLIIAICSGFIRKNAIKKKSFGAIILVTTIMSVILYLVYEYYLDDYIIQNRILDQYSYITRHESLKLAIKFFKEKWVTGFGIGNYEKFLFNSGVNMNLFSSVYMPYTVHNAFVSIILENGILFGSLMVISSMLIYLPQISNMNQWLSVGVFVSFGMAFNISLLSDTLYLFPLTLYLYQDESYGTQLLGQPKGFNKHLQD